MAKKTTSNSKTASKNVKTAKTAKTAKTTKTTKKATPTVSTEAAEKIKREFIKKKDLIAEIAKTSNVSKKEIAEIVNAFTEILSAKFAEGKSITFQGFGSFLVTDTKARDIKVFGKEIHVPDKKTVKFKPSKALKAKCNG